MCWELGLSREKVNSPFSCIGQAVGPLCPSPSGPTRKLAWLHCGLPRKEDLYKERSAKEARSLAIKGCAVVVGPQSRAEGVLHISPGDALVRSPSCQVSVESSVGPEEERKFLEEDGSLTS